MAETEQETREERTEQEARRRFVLAAVRQYPDPVLRLKAHPVTDFGDALGQLVDRMLRVMEGAHGVGLAAPQLGVLQRVVVHQADEETPPVALVNPRIVRASEELDLTEEGCLSLGAAGVRVEVERPEAVTVEAQAPSGEPISVVASGLEARVLQHEIDHLEGILIIDRTTPEQRRVALGELRPVPTLGTLA